MDIAGARLDYERAGRTGLPEVVFGAGKTLDQNRTLLGALAERCGWALATRIPVEQRTALCAAFPAGVLEPASGAFRIGSAARSGRTVSVVCAGTSDLPVAREAAFTLETFGHAVVRKDDIGVAGIHRLFAVLDEVRATQVIIAVAGMEGALPSVIAGLVSVPVIAVPTSVGYGTAFGGVTALLAMMTSCAPGIGVVNIDNGFGAAALAHKMLDS